MHLRTSLILSAVLASCAFGLDNGSFESRGHLDPWRPLGSMQGNKGQLKVVQDVRRQGRQSLMLSASGGNEAGVSQVIQLPANSMWRARCWIKTRQLNDAYNGPSPTRKGHSSPSGEGESEGLQMEGPAGDSTGGEARATLQIRTMENGIVAEAPGLSDALDWKELELAFRAPAKGSLSLILVLEGAKSDGQAWFDDVQLDRVENTEFQERVLDFPIMWAKGMPYTKLLPKDVQGLPGAWSCGQVARAQILRYWSLKTRLRCSGTYWYYRRDTKELLQADYNVPFPWERMGATLADAVPTDPKVDPIADFAYRLCVAQRTNWPKEGDGPNWGYARGPRDVAVQYFGFDANAFRSIYFSQFLKTHTWNDVYDTVRREIDEGRPVCMHLTGSRPNVGHYVVITGYRKVADVYEFMINWGSRGGYNPAQSFRIDQPIGGFDTPDTRSAIVGIQPDTVHEQLPLYNKIAEQWDSDYDAWVASDLLWNPNRREYAAIYPAGPKAAQRLHYQRISAGGLPLGGSVPLTLRGNCRKPVLAWSGSSYGIAWEDRTEKIGIIYFARFSPTNGRLLDPAPIRIGPGASDPWRPSVTLACSGSEFALVYAVNGRLEFIRISSGGQLLADSRRTIADGIDPHLVWLGDSYALAYAAGSEVYLARLDREGVVQGRARRVSSAPGLAAYTPKVVWSDSQFGIAWEHYNASKQHQILFCRADNRGEPIEGSLVTVNDFDSDPGRYVRNPCLSCRKGEFILTYRKNDAYLTRLSDKGKVLENRYLSGAPEYLTHVTSGDVTHVLYVQPHSQERSVEVQSCLFPLGK